MLVENLAAGYPQVNTLATVLATLLGVVLGAVLGVVDALPPGIGPGLLVVLADTGYYLLSVGANGIALGQCADKVIAAVGDF